MPKRYWIIFGTFSLAMLLYIDRILISVAKPEVSRDLALSDKEIGWVLSIFSLGYALFQVPAGALADKIGSRKTLTLIVSLWSAFTALTGLAWGFISLLTIRFIFGAGEAGAYPSINRAVFSWIPIRERGMVNGINFSAGRLGAAFALPSIAWLIKMVGWQMSFFILGIIGVVWAVAWYWFFRDDPTELRGISDNEKSYILEYRQQQTPQDKATEVKKLRLNQNVWLLMLQYFSSNFTFFFCLTWLFPHLKSRFQLDAMDAAFYASVPLIFGALGNLIAGFMVDTLYKRGHHNLSRQATAIVGFFLASVGLFCSIYTTTAFATVILLSIVVLGADMTLSPSWATCSDIGGLNSGKVSGAMNMFGNLGAFFTALVFPYLHDWSGSDTLFFYIGTGLNVLGMLYWFKINPSLKI
jgi:MFS transporter, ACS family, glucarate transporter